MTPELYQRLKPLYDAALDLSGEARTRFVAEACGKDGELKRELEALLAAHDQKGETLDRPLVRLGGFFAEDVFSPGDLLDRRFKIVCLLGKGGMGHVYEAKDIHLDPGRIALKTIKPEIACNPSILARFKDEVVLARQVSGPHVCRIYDLHLPESEVAGRAGAYLTMEYLEGVTLAARISERGPVPPKEAMEIATQLCAALQSIHGARIVHRDLKPNNVMLVPRNGSEQVVVMDFGLAHALTSASPNAETGLTVPGMIMGAPQYMAPEQFEGREATPATDIYALGIVLYEMVTGKHPFAAHTTVGAAARRARRPDSPSSIQHGLPHNWDYVIAKCLEYEPERRYQSAREVIEDLKQFRLEIVNFSPGQRIVLTKRGIYATTGVLMALLGVSGWLLYQYLMIHRPPPEAQKWYTIGVAALREGTYFGAVKALKEAVDIDRNFTLAHARLADAWSELDFTGQAQQEMLLATAPEQRNSVPRGDRKYVDAVHATLVRDYSAAAQDYEETLKQMPENQKANGYVDLGRAYEKAGKIKETLENYEKAAKLDRDDPAPLVHMGILKSRQRDPAGAEEAFSAAEELYRKKGNQEGLAEVAYQRGYAANEAADDEHAYQYLNLSLNIAREMRSSQLEARTLSQLSSVEYYDGKDDKAIEDAKHAVKIADENGLEYWKADGLMRLGNAYYHKEDYETAETYAQQALELAKQAQHPRIEASAKFTLASIYSKQGAKLDEQIAYAKEAQKYYQDYGFMNNVTLCSILIVRAEESKGDYAQALKDSTEQLERSQKTQSLPSEEIAEEAVGSSLSGLQNYPAALAHFDKALQIGHTLHYAEAFHEWQCADMLWRLGRYQDAEEMLQRILHDDSQRRDLGSGIADTHASMLLSRGKNAEALSVSRKALLDFKHLDPGTTADLLEIAALAEVRLGKIDQARKDADLALAAVQNEANHDLVAQAELVEADVYVSSHAPAKALAFARSANTYFSAKDEKESEWLSFFCMAEASKESGDIAGSVTAAKKSLDILWDLEQSWSPVVFQQYGARPDLHVDIQQLTNLVHSA